ncbi:MAG TPA: type II toxin-antitoxin system RelE/ParE family toxin [Chitinophagaceae bacterium]|nr:type II toxin-antitoxin system RelE/ParE family toxin [Chitinophagaceae bacterium]
MVKKRHQVVWTTPSQQHIRAAWKYISNDSPKNARKVIEDIITAAEKAIDNPEFYPPDKYKTNNDGSYRAFEKHGYRIVYRYTKNIVRVLRVRHTKMEPKHY